MDFDAMVKELVDAGYFVSESHGDYVVGINTYESYTRVMRVYQDGAVYIDGAIRWDALDIVARHVRPRVPTA